ncbi:MAG: GTP-binding protein [Oscillospiraceae bacterium]|jgi:G3E family GTPase|nr:GTP-binding protein [Oscillospiraceae bacterium]
MVADMYIVSGFLGAGKTTLIRQLLSDAFQGARAVLVENDFGDESVDAALMRRAGVEVAELASGCICCNISGDFVKSLRRLLARYAPEVVVIEPSGVGKLSDIAALCGDDAIGSHGALKRKVTVVDAVRCAMYLDNFGEFFEDQIACADAVVLSRCDGPPDIEQRARSLVRTINAGAPIYLSPLSKADISSLLAVPGHPAAAHMHGHGCGCDDCAHSAEEAFDTVTVRTSERFSQAEIRRAVAEAELCGTLLRAKGFLPGHGCAWDVQYVPGELKIASGHGAGAGIICLVGKNLDCGGIAKLFRGETGGQ